MGREQKKPSYAARAFNNLLNYTFLGATIGVTAVQWGSWGWLPLAIGAAAELLWLTVGCRVGPARRYFNLQHATEQKQLLAGHQQELLRVVGEADRLRFHELDSLRKDIQKQVVTNPSLTMSMVQGELDKLDDLLTSFLNLANQAARYESYVASSDLNELENDVRKQEVILEKSSDDEARSLAQKNLEIMNRRLEKAIEVRKQVRNGRAQLNLIENTFKLLRDQIVTMSSPKELSGQIEELTTAIDSIEATGKETDAIMRRLDGELSHQ